jgi:tRNA threonylcarbamoyladenosine biosynthesis protein TsaE
MTRLRSGSVDATQALGRALGEVLQAGDVVALVGPLGAGKTAFAQGVALGLGVPPSVRVASPTFTIVNEHHGRVTMYHADLYRLGDDGELDEIGFRDYLGGDGVCVVEWPELMIGGHAAQTPERLQLELIVADDDTRTLTATAHGATAEARLQAWLAKLGGAPIE